MGRFTTPQRINLYLRGVYYNTIGWYIWKKPSEKSFKFNGNEYEYNYVRQDQAYRSERVVEIPLAKEFIAGNQNTRLLEIGNTTQQYMGEAKIWWDVVDRYERAKGVHNEDLLAFKPSENYDSILSISTLEHVGFDEAPTRQYQEP